MLIKICGLCEQRAVDAAAGIAFDHAELTQNRADFCGFIFYPPSPRNIPPEDAGILDSHNLRRVGVFVLQDAAEIAAIAKTAQLDLLQMHGSQNPEQIALAKKLAESETGHAIGIIRTFWPARFACLADMERAMHQYAGVADFFLFDAGKSSGGSGQTLDWTDLAKVQSPKKWLLAGGLRPDNLMQAVSLLQSNASFAGLDINSGLEDSPGHKNPDLIQTALKLLRHMHGRNR